MLLNIWINSKPVIIQAIASIFSSRNQALKLNFYVQRSKIVTSFCICNCLTYVLLKTINTDQYSLDSYRLL